MNKNFAEWYRLVSIEPRGDVLESRWAGVEEWSTSLRTNDDAVLESVRIFQGLPEVSSREAFLAAFRKHDAAFPQRNELELRVLAGAALVKCVEPTGDDGDQDGARAAVIAGTALETSRLRVSDPQLGEVASAVLEGLHDVARRQRKRLPVSTALISSKAETEAVEAMKQVHSTGDLNVLKAHVVLVLQAMLEGVLQAQGALSEVAHSLRCADEETDILWWLEGRYSRDLNKPWSALGDEVPLLAGWELADLTDVTLGPRDAAAFLQRVVTSAKGKGREQPLQDYVNAVSDGWAKRRTTNLTERALDLAPLSLALLLRTKSGTSHWQQYFGKTSGVLPTTLLSPEVAAKQAYMEAVLLRTLGVTED